MKWDTTELRDTNDETGHSGVTGHDEEIMHNDELGHSGGTGHNDITGSSVNQFG